MRLAVVVEQVGDFATQEQLDEHGLSRLVARPFGAECLVLLLRAARSGKIEQVGICHQVLAHLVGEFGTGCPRQIAGKPAAVFVVAVS